VSATVPLRETRRTAPVPITAGRDANPAVWWAVVGAVAIALQLYVYAAWIFSGDAVRTLTGPDPIPGYVKITAWILQVLGPVGSLTLLVWCIRQYRRTGRLGFDTLLAIGWCSMVWQDPGLNILRTQIFYNSYLFNRGSWATHIPGWVSPNGQLLPEPLLFTSLMYATSGLVFAVLICAILRAVHRRRPLMTKVQLVGSAIGAAFVIDLLIELAFIRTGMYAYGGAVQSLSIFGGTRYQFPVYEAVFWMPVWGVLGALRYFRDDRGRSLLERKADNLTGSEGKRNAVRILAFCGLINVLLLGYNLSFTAMGVWGGPTPDMPSWLRNGMCGEGTHYDCPAPGLPIPVINGEPTR
jgi:hypothetical protein